MSERHNPAVDKLLLRRFFKVTREIPQAPPPGAADLGHIALERLRLNEMDWSDFTTLSMSEERLARMVAAAEILHSRRGMSRKINLIKTLPFALDLVVSLASRTADQLALGKNGTTFDTIVPASLGGDTERTTAFLRHPANLVFATRLFDATANVLLDPHGAVMQEAKHNFQPALVAVSERFKDAPDGDLGRTEAMNAVRGPFGELIEQYVRPALAPFRNNGPGVEQFAHNISVGIPDAAMVRKHFPPQPNQTA